LSRFSRVTLNYQLSGHRLELVTVHNYSVILVLFLDYLLYKSIGIYLDLQSDFCKFHGIFDELFQYRRSKAGVVRVSCPLKFHINSDNKDIYSHTTNNPDRYQVDNCLDTIFFHKAHYYGNKCRSLHCPSFSFSVPRF
jgi:hypothetical protein